MLAALRDSEHAEISVVLAGQEESIKFVGVHVFGVAWMERNPDHRPIAIAAARDSSCIG
jgi:hypothetical protein